MHARQVVASLHMAEGRLDSEPQAALEELGALLLKIADRYCESRVGAMLDQEQLGNVQPVPDREWMRIAIWASLSAGVVILISRASLPDGAEPTVMVFAVLTIMAIVWNRRVRQALDLLGIVTGGP
ncbi:hypothetical protein ACFWMT_20400 [Streptomyces sp. NPDC058368]|uniref:hypothetical protein n=1 Tax=Streptomyces sp. NPDC058368 TaxID=3346461 RepID=UPI0036520CA7